MAQRQGNGAGTTGLTWLLGDHLGSTAITANGADGTLQSELRYKPWGEPRFVSGVTLTDRRYTGQRAEGTRLVDYGARFYDPALGRWVQPDSLISDPGNFLDFDRYAYVKNNSIQFNDPTGQDVGCSAVDPKCKKQNNYTDVDRMFIRRSQYEDWESRHYGGCFKGHAAVANGKVALTNQELVTLRSLFQLLLLVA